MDAIIDPAHTREALIEALEAAALNPHVRRIQNRELLADLNDQTPVNDCRMPARRMARVQPKLFRRTKKSNISTRLVSLGFRHIDAVSFVSPKHVPQMADSEAVMQAVEPGQAALRRSARNYRHRRQRTRPGTRARHARRDDDRLSVFDFRVFSARERKYVPRENRAHWSKSFSARRKPPAASWSSTSRWRSEIHTTSRGAGNCRRRARVAEGVGVRTVSLADTVGHRIA